MSKKIPLTLLEEVTREVGDDYNDFQHDWICVSNGSMEPVESRFYGEEYPKASQALQLIEDQYAASFPTVYVYQREFGHGGMVWDCDIASEFGSEPATEADCRSTELHLTDPIFTKNQKTLRIDIYEGGSLSESFRTPERLLELRNRALDYFGEELE